MSSAAPWQFLARAVAVIVGLTLLLIVDVRGVAFYVAWALIGPAGRPEPSVQRSSSSLSQPRCAFTGLQRAGSSSGSRAT